MRWTVNDTGSTTALSQVVTGSADVAFFTRELTEAERRSVSVNGLGFVGQVIAVHPDNPVTSLTREQLRGIFGGTITDWAAVGGQAGPITVLVRQAGSATREALDPLLLGPGGTYGVSATTIGDAAGMVAAVARSRGSIGMVGQPHLPPGPSAPKALAIDGVAPSVPNIAR